MESEAVDYEIRWLVSAPQSCNYVAAATEEKGMKESNNEMLRISKHFRIYYKLFDCIYNVKHHSDVETWNYNVFRGLSAECRISLNICFPGTPEF